MGVGEASNNSTAGQLKDFASRRKLTRREMLRRLVCAVMFFPLVRICGFAAGSSQKKTPCVSRVSTLRKNTFAGTIDSLKDYEVPEWFKNARLGIWAHWGPQSAPEYGDWYARNMYIQGTRQYRYHVVRYGHPSVFGYKDVIDTWHGRNFDPDYLVRLYRRMGAQYFVSMGVHVDNFDLWNSAHTRWNSVNFGIRKDVVGLFRKAALKYGMRFGVSDHLWMAYKWMSVARGCDSSGPYAGIPYDGSDPQYSDLYGDCPVVYRKLPWDEEGIPEKWKVHWSLRIKDLIDKYKPDLLYCDGPIPFGSIGLDVVAHFYNVNLRANGGRLEAVYTCKSIEQAGQGICVLDKERGVVEDPWPAPWQTCTCIGNWHYDIKAVYKTPKQIVDMFVDIIVRGGRLLLNFPLRCDGTLDSEELRIIHELTDWISVNREAIFESRPWKIWGAGPTRHKVDPNAKYTEYLRVPLTHQDVRFMCGDRLLYVFFMGWPETRFLRIDSLAIGQPHVAGRIRSVQLLGTNAPVRWEQDHTGLKVWLPPEPPCKYAAVLKIVGLET